MNGPARPQVSGQELADLARLSLLKRTALLDTPAGESFDRLTRLAARLIGAPVALVSLVDADRQVFPSCFGLPEPWASTRQTPLSHSFCQHVVTTGAPLIIENAELDPRVRGNLAIRDLGVIAYAGIPLVTPGGDVLGSFCVIDHQPRRWQPEELELLEELARSVATEIALRLELADRIEAESALRLSEAVKGGIVRSALDAIITIDADGVVQEFNPAAERIFGFGREAAIGRAVGELIVPPDLRQAHVDGLARHRATGIGPILGRRLEITGMRSDGSLFPVELAVIPIERDDGGQLFTAHLRDISERKAAEAEILAARRAAEQSAEAKRQFLAHMSHEIRTPLSAAVGAAHLLGTTPLTDEQARYLETLAFSADLLLTLLNDLLDFSKIDSGRLEFEAVPFDLRALLRGLIASLRFPATEKQLGLELEIAPAVPAAVVGDPGRLKQILFNLLGNALKFTERGRVVLQADLSTPAEGAPQLRLRVEDTGIGIAAERLEAVFAPFTQERSDIARRYGGTGLGLAIVRQLVERQGGRIFAESQPGAGSRFTVELPLVTAPGLAAPPPDEVWVDRLGGIRILLVEDNRVNQLIAQRLLTRAGATVSVASHGGEALESLRSESFDVVLMDLNMPELDGFEATRRIREELQIGHDRLRVLALSASALPEDHQRALDCGADGTIAKPFHPAALCAAIEQSLRERDSS